MREVVLDTETTGLDPNTGDRLVEVGCIELLNLIPTGRQFHSYLDPERPMPAEAFSVHGLSNEFLAGKPRFRDIVDDLLTFLGESPLVIHNAAFDLGFINAELARLDRPALLAARAIDTVRLARERYPGAPANLDALCRRFGIDVSERGQHGALKDACLLAEVYLQLRGGKQPALALVTTRLRPSPITVLARSPRLIPPTVAEDQAHRQFVARLPGCRWQAFE